MIFFCIASFILVTTAQGQDQCSTSAERDTGGTCMLANAATGVTGWAASGMHYLAGTDLLDCDAWRGNSSCINSKCMCAPGVCATNGQCGGREGEMTCGGTANGAECMFPFTYLGNEYENCTTQDNGDTAWCMVAGGLQWGECNCMSVNCVDDMTFLDANSFNCSSWDGFYCPGAPMYGYTEEQTQAVLDNCPLTCKVCFPPLPTPGQGDIVVFKVLGSVSFTIDAAVADDFLGSSTAQAALEDAMMDLAGPLSTGVTIVLFGGGDVEGITAFCQESDCDDGQVMMVDDDLPSSCQASACTSSECCVDPAVCSMADCDARSHVLKAEPPETCLFAECWQEECCDFRALCSNFSCPNTHVLLADPLLCENSTCTPDECCELRGSCMAPARQLNATDNSSFETTNPEQWMGCPPSSHVDKSAALDVSCIGAECTVWECCDMRDICNVTSACQESTHVPKDRDGESCEGAECREDECCDPRDSCQASDCDSISATHAPKSSPPSPCWGAACSLAECCELRASCEVSACSGADLAPKENPALCNSGACLQDECCVMFFEGYKRTSAYLTMAHGNVEEYSPSLAIAECSADVTCAGITCDLNANGVATLCTLRLAGGDAGEGGDSVSFVTVLCQSSVCTENWVLKGDTLPPICTAGCDRSECCDERASCATDNTRCASVAMVDNGFADSCAGAACLDRECCDPRDSCQVSDCNEDTHVAKINPPLYCDAAACDLNGECCDERAQCGEAVCGDSHVLKPSGPFPGIHQPNRCLGPECTVGECCNPKATCQESDCPRSGYVFSVQVPLCLTTLCSTTECCSERATCTAEACGEVFILRPEGERVSKCETDECNAAECCEPKGQCSPDICPTGLMLKENFPSLCVEAECQIEECCVACPFEGLWQSTNVFGGDQLEVLTVDGEMKVKIVSMPMVQFDFAVGDQCSCTIALDALTLATGMLSATADSISWDTILNNDVWMSVTDRRLDARASERFYEIRDGGIVVLGQNRRLQQQDIRVDFEIEAANAADALAISGIVRELDVATVQATFDTQLASHGTDYTIGSVYQIDDPQTEQVVIPSNMTTSGALKSSVPWFLVLLMAIVAAMV